MSLSKKIFIVSSILFALLLIFLGVYNLSFKTAAPQTQGNASNNSASKTPAVIPTAAAAKITAISDEAVLSPVLDAKNSVLKYYSKTTGKVYQINPDGSNKKTISDTELPGLMDVFWSPDFTKAITQFAAGNNTNFFYYDYTTNKGIPLKSNLDTVVWQNNNKIFYKYYDPKTQERSLNIADPDGSNWFKIADLNYKNVFLAPVPRTGLVSFWNSPDASAETDFESVPIIGGDAKAMLKGNFGTDYLWNNDGSSVLVSHSDQKNGSQIQLAVMNSQGGEFKNLNVSTFVSKSAWSKDNKTVYYALPGSFPSNSTLPNDYMSGKFNTNDSFWKIDTSTGEKKQLLGANDSGSNLDATDLFLNADESALFFVNKVDSKLYRIDL